MLFRSVQDDACNYTTRTVGKEDGNKEKDAGLGKRKRVNNNKYGSPMFHGQKATKRQAKSTKGMMYYLCS